MQIDFECQLTRIQEPDQGTVGHEQAIGDSDIGDAVAPKIWRPTRLVGDHEVVGQMYAGGQHVLVSPDCDLTVDGGIFETKVKSRMAMSLMSLRVYRAGEDIFNSGVVNESS